MGTRSRITVILSEEDCKQGKVLVFDPKKIDYEYKHVNLFGKPTCLEKVEFESLIVPKGAEAISMYCQFDGYPTAVGQTLVRDYNTYEKALNLTLGGPAECIDRRIKVDNTWSGGYLNCKAADPLNTRPNTIFCKKDKVFGEAYEYLFKDGKWYVRNDSYYYTGFIMFLERFPYLYHAVDIEKLIKYRNWMLVEDYIDKIENLDIDRKLASFVYETNPKGRVDELRELFENIDL